MENDLLAITLAQIMELNRNLANIKNSLSLTFEGINIVFISHVIRNVAIFLKILI